MSADNYLLITENAAVYEGQGVGPCPYAGQLLRGVFKTIAAAILFCENYQRREIIEYGYSLTDEARARFATETGEEKEEEEEERICPTCHQSIIKYDAEGFPTNL